MGTNYTNGYIVVRKGFEHPEALIKTMNLWCELNVDGGQYVQWLAEQTTGKYKSVSLLNEYMFPYAMEGVTSFTDTGAAIRDIFASDNPDETAKKYPFVTSLYAEIKDPSDPAWLTGAGWWHKLVYTSGASVMESYLERGLQFNEFQGMLSEDSAFNKVTLDKLMVETYTNIIMGESIDTFDAFVAEWYAEGGQEILDEANAWYAAK
jgi:putative aldouronate transport system substrate-binding protein